MDSTIEVEEMDFRIGMEEECNENYDEIEDEDSFLCCLSEFQENTGLEITYDESN